MKEFIEQLIGRLEEKFKYNSEQAEIYRDGSDKDAYFREKKDLYMDRANTYGQVMRIVNELAEEYKGKYVRIGTLEQVMWERDVAISQLEALGYGFGEKVGWIPVSERLPEDGQSIIAKYADGKIWQENFSLYLYENPRTYQMVAWIPMPPEPYKKGENNNERNKIYS